VSAIAPAFAVVAALTLAAGVAKLRAPAATGTALARIGLPGSDGVVRALATVEVAVGTGALISPGPLTGVLLALAYLAFAVVIAGLVRLGEGSVPCGCFGAGSFSATRAHAGFDLVAAAVALAGALDPPLGPLDWFGDPLIGVAASAAVACSVWLAYVLFTLVPAVWTAPAR
jgi:hypothetical protein